MAERQLWLVPSPGQTARTLVAEVAANVPRNRLYAFAVPPELEDQVGLGALLTVPLGRSGRPTLGMCLRLTRRPWDHTLRPVLAARPGPSWLSERLIELVLWVSEYYFCPPWKTLMTVWPGALRQPRQIKVCYVRATGVAPAGRLSAGQAALLAALGTRELPREQALACAGVRAGTLRTLVRRGLVECLVRAEPAPRERLAAAATPECPADRFTLTAGQAQALSELVAAIDAPPGTRVFTLFGVPGSGKTEVYVRAIREVVRRGRQAILLVPEIALATQVVERLATRLPRVVVLHSRLAAARRRNTLTAIATGEADVVIGTRTAVFAPCPRLGLIVVDEEQETSFKSLAAPFYHARDVAVKRGQLEGVPVVLGSATPALETWNNLRTRQHYKLLTLPERVSGACWPQVRLVRTGAAAGHADADLLCAELQEELAATLAAGHQAILLHNRRGYATFLRCATCGLMVSCTQCGCHLVYHRTECVLKCHHCGRRTAVPSHCLDDSCRGALRRTGAGIQRLEEELRRFFPQARVLRLDRDTMRRREDYGRTLRDFEAGAADILLGTQMVAKGLDFPGVRLVGVIAADAALSLPDFRAAERVFQLIVQVVGRAGRRSESSLAVVQTMADPPRVIRRALQMDYESFAAEELNIRRRLCLPPSWQLVRIVCADGRPYQAAHESQRLALGLRDLAAGVDARVRVDDAEPCVVSQLRQMRRYQVLVRAPRGAALHAVLRAAEDNKLLPPRVQRCTVDVDPVDLW